ncbi:MAG: LysM peptidoglycan-binding domain-containing protein [Nitrospira defluvii]|nr:LysM peptidoglycan-binding domain-containing protein [Nitrospira defluvii]
MNTVIQRNIRERRMAVGVRVGCWMASVLIVPLWGGCAPLEPIAGSAPSDLQVAADSLKMAVRDAQRMAADLRAELDQQRKDLADAQVARAQLQGILRETERRLEEARQIIELQREELASARVERERVAQALRPLHSRLRQPSSVVPYQSKMPQSGLDGVVPASAGLREKAVVWPFPKEEESISETSPIVAETGPVSEESRPGPASMPEVVPVAPIRTVVIQDGDTLWRLSRRHKVSLEALRSLNGLPNNLIVTGRTLRLPEPRLHQTDSQASIGALVR